MEIENVNPMDVSIETKMEPAEEVFMEAGNSPPGEQTNIGQPSEEDSGGFFDAQKQEKEGETAAAGDTSSAPVCALEHLPHEGKAYAEAEEAAPPVRDFTAEWRELAEAHPEVVGKELPDDIYQACMTGDLPPLRVYETMMLAKQAEEIESLKKEIATLRQNAETAARAPVSAVSGSGAIAEPEDPFIKALRSF